MASVILISLITGISVAGIACWAIFRFFVRPKWIHNIDQQAEIAEGKLVVLQAECDALRHELKELKAWCPPLPAYEGILSKLKKTYPESIGFVQYFETISAGATKEETRAAYFNMFTKFLQAFSQVYNRITDTYSELRNQSVYLEDGKREIIENALNQIKNYYDNKAGELARAQAAATALFQQKQPDPVNWPFSFELFYQELITDWNSYVKPVLKNIEE